MGGEKASTTASVMGISYCDVIRTQIINWSQISVCTKMWNLPKNSGIGAVQGFNVVIPIATVPVQFIPRPGTEPPIWNRCDH
jgi:hypothetical protein